MVSEIANIVAQMCPKAADNYTQAIAQGQAQFTDAGITTPLRIAHFLAQALHECGRFTVLREEMSYSAPRLLQVFGVNVHSAAITPAEADQLAHQPELIAERVYGLGNPHKAQELGNTQPGDGFRYRGNGVLQMTGRGAHRKAGQACGVDFEGDPDRATAPQNALKPALQEWTDGGLNAFADKNDIRTITLKINGGLNGFTERQDLFKEAFALLSGGAEPSDAAVPDNDVQDLQTALNTLGANPKLQVDGKFGPATEQAVMAFQRSANIPADGIPGPVTKAALQLALAARR